MRTGLRQRPLRPAALQARQAAARRASRSASPKRSKPIRELIEQHLGQYADIEHNPFVALNTGFVRDGAFIHFARGAIVEQPIHLLFISTAGARADRLASARAGRRRGQRRSDGRRKLRRRRQRRLLHQRRHRNRRRRRLPHRPLQAAAGKPRARITSRRCRWTWAAAAKFVSHSATLGAQLTRNDLNVVMAGEYADATLNGLVLIGGEQHVRQPHAARPRQAQLPEPRAVQARAGRQIDRRVQGQDPRPPGRAEDRLASRRSKSLLLSDDAVHEQPAGAGDLRRRREVHARLDDRPGGRRAGVLPPQPRRRAWKPRGIC